MNQITIALNMQIKILIIDHIIITKIKKNTERAWEKVKKGS